MREEVSDELDNMNIISHRMVRLAAPIVPVLKSDVSVRICGDFKVTK